MSTPVKSSDDGVLSQASDQASSRDEKLLPPLPGTHTSTHLPPALGITPVFYFCFAIFNSSCYCSAVPVVAGLHRMAEQQHVCYLHLISLSVTAG